MKKEQSDSSIGELLKKLHASFTSDKADKPEKKRQKDTDDSDLMEQLKATLDKVSSSDEKANKPEKKPKKRASKPKKPTEEPIIPEISVEEPTVEVVEEPIVEVVEEPTVEAVDEPTVEAVDEPTVEVVDEPKKIQKIKIRIKNVSAEPEPIKKKVVKKARTVQKLDPAPKKAVSTAASKSDSIVIKPKPVPETKPDASPRDPSAHIIRPPSRKQTASEPIVIRPRAEHAPSPRPRVIGTPTEPQTHTITIKDYAEEKRND